MAARIVVLGLLVLVLAALALLPQPAPRPPPEIVALLQASAIETAAGQLGPALTARQRLALGVPLDLNRARADELDLLPGIGPRLARRLVAARQAHGGWQDLAELERLRGIGPRQLARWRGLLAIGPVTRASPQRAPPAAPPAAR